MKGISEADRKLLEQAEEWLGAEPTKMGPVKNLFWGNIKEDYYFPYPAAGRPRAGRVRPAPRPPR
jgi:acyl-CoA dehydrogenase family protein 9